METDRRGLASERMRDGIANLPTLPAVVAKLIALDREDDRYFDKILELLEAEPNLAVRVLAIANSAAVGSAVPTTMLRPALGRVGSQAASNMLLAAAMTQVFVPRDDYEKGLWRHAVRVGVVARRMGRKAGLALCNPEEAYTCGLVHDIGRFVLFREAPRKLKRIDESDWESPTGLLRTERAVCGFTHAQVGAMVCRQWGLPETIVDVVNDHHTPEDARHPTLTAIVHCADLAMFPSVLPGAPGTEEADDETLREKVWAALPPFLDLSLDELRTMIAESTEESAALLEALGVG
ncbi:MAG TPA: HDOD domain-containing protein [Planctomycetes bacterium]|nr:HDOD domain-containing protein [Planctomycetota bacterium]